MITKSPKETIVTLDWGEVYLLGVDQALRSGVMKAILAELEPTELPDDEIIPDETRPLEDEPVKTDQVPEE